MTRSWSTSIAIFLVSAAAFLVASPWRERIAVTWMPAANFALGVGLVTLSFVELGRAAGAWLTHTAPLGWIAGGALVGLGLFATGSSSMIHARDSGFDWIAIAGILTAIGGLRWQRRFRGAEADAA